MGLPVVSAPRLGEPDAHATAIDPPKSVTWRAVAIALFLIPVNAYWVIQMERVRYSAHPTTISLFFNCIFILVVLTGINGLVQRYLRRSWALRQGELLLIYSMLCIGSCMASHDMGQVLVPGLSWPYAHDNSSNNYLRLVGQYLPRWAMVPDTKATLGMYRGNDTLYTSQHIRAWLPVALIWSGFIAVLLFTMQCVNVIIRKQWMEYEKLTFPLTKLPIEITNAQPGARTQSALPLTANRIFWAGFILAAFIDSVNSLNYYVPSVPAILTPGNGVSSLNLWQFFPTKPWNAIGWTPLSFYPFLVGIGMLMPMDFLFSSWFFYIVWKLEAVITVAMGLDADSRMPYSNYQAFGAYFLFLVSTLWLSRKYFRDVVNCALGRKSALSDDDEPMRYRNAFCGMGAGLCLLIGFSVALGLAWWLAALFFVIYLALALAITRMRAELGTPVHDLHFTGPDWALTDLLGPKAIGAHGLGVFTLFFWFNRAYRGHPMPHQMEAFKFAEQGGARREMRGWFWALLVAGAFGMFCAFWALLHCYYHYGADAKMGTFGPEAWDRYTSWIKQPKVANTNVAAASGVGFVFAAFLQAMRIRFFWWPLHPLAYAVSGSWEMNLVWMPLLIAWAIKGLVLKYGGVKTYQSWMPFFYGLILGQFIPGSLLNIWGIITENPTYQFWQ